MQAQQTTSHNDGPPWNIITNGGPVVATAIHAGHVVRDELAPYLAIDPEDRRREEDPLTDYFLSLSDNLVRVNRSRFECDMNRPRTGCISPDPADTWGLKIWQDGLPQGQIETSRQLHDRFYAEMRTLFDRLLDQHGRLLVLDLHSYNHRRDGAEAEAALSANFSADAISGLTVEAEGMIGDIHGTKEYRAHLVAVMTKRAVTAAG